MGETFYVYSRYHFQVNTLKCNSETVPFQGFLFLFKRLLLKFNEANWEQKNKKVLIIFVSFIGERNSMSVYLFNFVLKFVPAAYIHAVKLIRLRIGDIIFYYINFYFCVYSSSNAAYSYSC